MSFAIGVFIIVLLDQISKIWVQNHMALRESIPIIKGIFHITYIQNPHSSFGLLKFSNMTYTIITLLVLLLMILFLRSKTTPKNKMIFISLAMILGGSLGNMIDRFRIGSVIDFLDFRIWPIFNLADSAINVGLFLLIIHFLLHKETTEKPDEQ